MTVNLFQVKMKLQNKFAQKCRRYEMGKYVENNLNKNEVIVQKAKLNGLMLLSA